MEQKLREVLEDRAGNYILPFLWMHGEPEDVLTEEIDAIFRSGVRALCLESRVHPEFAKDGWFRDVDVVMREAKKRGMKVWVLDDKHFPTGFANGLIAEKYPERRKWQLAEHHVDVAGPRTGALLLLPQKDEQTAAENERTVLAAYAYPRAGRGEALAGEPVDLTSCVKGKFLCWKVPAGCWRIFVFYKTREGVLYKAQHDYISLIDPESVDVQIEAVYEPHWRRYGEEFGKTFAGFFSDEPCLGNGTFEAHNFEPRMYDVLIGTQHAALPWRDCILEKMEEKMGCDPMPWLAGLWYPLGEKTAAVRVAYMDAVTALYRDCFCRRLGDWCRERGAQYIGHVIEDMGCSTHLGFGSGHYFRALWGQDMAGVDVVLHQIVPGLSRHVHNTSAYGGTADPEFFDFMLAKLGSSLSHINPQMKGRAMCEVYGAYGWAEGVPVMKWLTDHMLVRGINWFVPHAFSPKFPDSDCPPHFYARGNNPQFEAFGELMRYTNRMSHLLSDGTHHAGAAILYHAEAEWSGGRFLKTQVPARILCEQQIDYDIVPADVLLQGAEASDGRLKINGESYPSLVVPYGEILPYALLEKLRSFADAGVPVFFAGGLPERSTEGREISALLRGAPFRCAEPEELPAALTAAGCREVCAETEEPYLRVYHCERGGSHFFMLFNEGMQPVETGLRVPFSGECLMLDVLGGSARRAALQGNVLPLSLAPYQSRVAVFSGDGAAEELPAEGRRTVLRRIPQEGPFLAEGFEQRDGAPVPAFSVTGGLFDVTAPERYPEFCGTERCTFALRIPEAGRYTLDLGEVGETVRLSVNGRPAGSRICPPYRFDLGALPAGELTVAAEAANSPAYRMRDRFSVEMMISASGVLGPVVLEEYTEE